MYTYRYTVKIELSEEATIIDRLKAFQKIKSLEKKLKAKEKEIDKLRTQKLKSLDFEYAFRKFLNRFQNRKYDSHFPIQRIDEAMIYLKELLP